jgi:hypothetical protein
MKDILRQLQDDIQTLRGQVEEFRRRYIQYVSQRPELSQKIARQNDAPSKEHADSN